MEIVGSFFFLNGIQVLLNVFFSLCATVCKAKMALHSCAGAGSRAGVLQGAAERTGVA